MMKLSVKRITDRDNPGRINPDIEINTIEELFAFSEQQHSEIVIDSDEPGVVEIVDAYRE